MTKEVKIALFIVTTLALLIGCKHNPLIGAELQLIASVYKCFNGGLRRIDYFGRLWIFLVNIVLCGYLFFELPTAMKEEVKAYEDFRKHLQKDGFTMF